MAFVWDVKRGALEPNRPTSFAGCEVLGELGRGAMGVVYRAHDPQLGRDVALKVLLLPSPEGARRERFMREAQLTAQVDVPGIVRVHRAGVEGRTPYIVYELIEGARGLDDAQRTASVEERCRLVEQVARALGAAHAQGIVHRDVKPENVLVDALGRARLLDFGVAKGLDLEDLTRTGALVGTPQFMAPEQLTGGDASPATDVWALGVLLHWSLTGALPFEAVTFNELVARVCRGARPVMPSSVDPTLPRALDAVVERALRVDPARRQADGAAFAEALAAATASRGARTLSWWIAAAVVVVLAILGGAGLAGVWGGDDAPGEREEHERAAFARPAPPQVSLDLPSLGVVGEDPYLLRGTVRSAEQQVVVRAGDERLVLSLERGAAEFALPVRLEEGHNRLRVVIEAEAGGVVTLEPKLELVPWPRWFGALPRELRPPFPLPESVSFGARAGEYVHARSRLVLLWVPPVIERGSGKTALGGFFAGQREVSWGAIRRFSRSAGTRPPPTQPTKGDNHRSPGWEDDDPVYNVSWDEAQAFCDWAEGRLPTEAEWDRCVTFGMSSEGSPSFEALGGSVREWCADSVPGRPGERVVRGGSWQAALGSVLTRTRIQRDHRELDLGFRIVVDPR